MITFACVWTGNKYGREYVERLAGMIARQYRKKFRMICLTDNDEQIESVEMIPIKRMKLNGWFAKMALFSPLIRGRGRCIYFDLDTVILGDLEPLIEFDGNFGICENFTKLAGNKNWACAYGSCVMSFREGWGNEVFNAFVARPEYWIEKAGKYGDQKIIEMIYPFATLLQDVLPKDYFIGYRDFKNLPPDDASIAIFAGSHKPDNSKLNWVKESWRA